MKCRRRSGGWDGWAGVQRGRMTPAFLLHPCGVILHFWEDPLKDLELGPELRRALNIGKTNSVSVVFITTPRTGDNADTSSFSLVPCCGAVEKRLTWHLAVSVFWNWLKDTFPYLKTCFSSTTSFFFVFWMKTVRPKRNGQNQIWGIHMLIKHFLFVRINIDWIPSLDADQIICILTLCFAFCFRTGSVVVFLETTGWRPGCFSPR